MLVETTNDDEKNLIRLGASSFSNKDWVGPFYPPGTRPAQYLEFYARHFSTVEIDSTYYAVPSASTVDGWSLKTPEDFIFSLKFPAAICHGGEGPQPNPDILLMPEKTFEIRDRFLHIAARLGKRSGPLILQFPYFARDVFASADPFLERLEIFLKDLPLEFRYAVEIRNRNWLNSDFADLCRRHQVCLVLTDYAGMPMADEMMEKFDPITTDFAYIRLIGNRKQIEAITTTWDREVIDRGDRLKRWAEVMRGFARRRIKTFIYVNNHYAGYAPETLRRLTRMIWEER